MRKSLIISLLVLSISMPYVAAHPFLEESYPNSAVNAPVGITEITVFYSEPIELDYSSLKVLDSNGYQIDNRDSKYHLEDISLIIEENSLVVTTPPLESGVYTVTSKVLSKVDGHLVDYAFIFGVGNAIIDIPTDTPTSIYEILFFPEAGARYPGLVGQTIVLGAIIASMLIWGTQNKDLIKKDIEKINSFHHDKLVTLIGVGLATVFASNIAMLSIQALQLGVSAFDVIQTTFGTSWLIRMIITLLLLGVLVLVG